MSSSSSFAPRHNNENEREARTQLDYFFLSLTPSSLTQFSPLSSTLPSDDLKPEREQMVAASARKKSESEQATGIVHKILPGQCTSHM